MAMRVATTPIRLRHRSAPVRPPVAPGMTSLGIPAVTIAGTTVHLTDSIGAREAVEEAVRTRSGAPLAVASVNLDHIHHLDALQQDPLGGSPRWLNLIDGAPIAAQTRRMTGTAWPRLAGSDLITGILDDAAAGGACVAVVGGSPDVSQALARRFAADWPSLRFAGHWTPAREEISSPESSLAVAAQIRAARADIVIVCLGKPRQEKWIDGYGEATGAGALLAFGAVVDFLAGRVSRAPRWVSDAGLEWMWRLMLEPRRLARRYLIEGPPAYVAVRRSSLPHRA
ncbi:WecB/TagA/CpsF family glycosyltransferase [Microbacterium caowuchunii]|uniref:WecB/TagA/CpsF family glycosyltransferase n=1 Tax=Microbacterium caowuchunii TaxID=2614638 RepID=UPI001245442C|nr:WecB/TagA/CpsF family glycosyltransferase [Microbacterium caowuchunii]QEW00803.1 WecB/TagA/CpsF family glycosyltransferase [Microbacterium caowuchunii]